MKTKPVVLIFGVTLCWCSFWLNGCGKEAPPVEISEVRVTPMEERVAGPSLSTADRMGLEQQAATSPHGIAQSAPAESGGAQDTSSDPSQIRWRAPGGWQEGEARPMRLATFVPEGASHTECVISILTGEAGGVLPNLNRWRGQIGLGPLTTIEQTALEQLHVLGVSATYMNCEGAAPVGSEQVQLLGIVCPLPNYTLFIKMAGPVSEMANEEEHFRNFADSLHFEGAARP